ncbi:DUF3459 domain-containing protein [Micromonospora sp. M12]
MLFMGRNGLPRRLGSSSPRIRSRSWPLRCGPGGGGSSRRTGGRREVPDPQDPETFVRSRLDWAELDKPEHREMLAFYQRLIALRRSRPDLSDPRLNAVSVQHGDQFLVMRRGTRLWWRTWLGGGRDQPAWGGSAGVAGYGEGSR